MLKMNVGGREDHMNPRPDRRLQRLRPAFNVMTRSPRQYRDNRTRHRRRNGLHRREVPIRSDRETGLDNVNSQLIELPPQPDFLMHVHAAARRLLAVAERRIKNSNSLAFHSALQSLNSFDFKSGGIESKDYN